MHLVPSTHGTAARIWQTQWVHYAVASVLFVTAVVIIWHHNRLHDRANRYKDLLTFAMVLSENREEIAGEPENMAAVSILDATVRALDPSGKRGRLINASILRRPNVGGEPFRIFAQDSRNAFEPDLEVPDDSVAGKVVKFDADKGNIGSLMYVPSTRFVHGVAFRKTTLWDGHGAFSEAEIIPATYRVVDRTTEIEVLKCLLCIQIPWRQAEPPGSGGYQYVLSLSGRKGDCMDTVFFSAAKLVAVSLVNVLPRGPAGRRW